MSDEKEKAVKKNSPFITPDEAAAWLRMTSATLAQKRHRGVGPKYYQPDGPGSKVLYRMSDLEEWVEGGQREGACDQGDEDGVEADA